MIKITSLDSIKEIEPQSFIKTSPLYFSEEKLKNWIEFSNDLNPIHNPDQLSSPIIPGNMLLSYIPAILQEFFTLSENVIGMNIGYKSVRFRQPICLYDLIYSRFSIHSLKIRKNIAFIIWEMHFFSDLEMQQIHSEFLIQDRYVFNPSN